MVIERILSYAVKTPSLRSVGFMGKAAHSLSGGRFTPGLSREIFALSSQLMPGEKVQIRSDGFYREGVKLAGNPFISERFAKLGYSDLNFGTHGYSESIALLRKDPSQILSRDTSFNALMERAKTQVKSNWQKYIKEIAADSVKINLSERERADLAKALATSYPTFLSMHINDFNIKDEDLMIEIALIATPTRHFKDFGIKRLDAKLEILRAAARKNIWGTAEYTENFDITEAELMKYCPDVILMLSKDKTCEGQYETAVSKIKAECEYASNLLDCLEAIRLSAKSNTFIACSHWVGSIIAAIETSANKHELIQAFLNNQDFFESLLRFHDPSLRKEYSEHLIKNMLRSLASPVSDIFNSRRRENLAGAMLIPIFEACRDKEHIYGQLKGIFKTPLMKDSRKQSHLIKALLVIARNGILTLEEKRIVLRIALESNRPTHYISFVRELIALGKAKELRTVKNTGDIKSLLDNEFKIMFDFGDPDEIVADALCNFKQIRLLEILSKRLKRTGLANWKLFCKWIKSVVSGDYPNIRYSEDRIHLNIVFDGTENPKEAEWRKGETISIKALGAAMTDPPAEKGKNSLWENINWYAEDTDDAETALRSGTDIDGSCLRIDGHSQYIPALLAILLDGKIRLLVLRDSEGNMIGRSLMRVLYDEHDKRPVLFVDQAYIVSSYDKKGIEEVLLEMSKRRARKLGMPLTWAIDGKNDYAKYPNVLTSYGGTSPNEVIDVNGAQKMTNVYALPANLVEFIQE